jgi:hypothetical protein
MDIHKQVALEPYQVDAFLVKDIEDIEELHDLHASLQMEHLLVDNILEVAMRIPYGHPLEELPLGLPLELPLVELRVGLHVVLHMGLHGGRLKVDNKVRQVVDNNQVVDLRNCDLTFFQS